jgi:hypothetical protein
MDLYFTLEFNTRNSFCASAFELLRIHTAVLTLSAFCYIGDMSISWIPFPVLILDM